MDFLGKLDSLMAVNGLTKATLSKGCGIPYTTISGWYNSGYEGIKLSTISTLSDYFGVTLDYWMDRNFDLSIEEIKIVNLYRKDSGFKQGVDLLYALTTRKNEEEKESSK